MYEIALFVEDDAHQQVQMPLYGPSSKGITSLNSTSILSKPLAEVTTRPNVAFCATR